jgi:hypothetical protein
MTIFDSNIRYFKLCCGTDPIKNIVNPCDFNSAKLVEMFWTEKYPWNVKKYCLYLYLWLYTNMVMSIKHLFCSNTTRTKLLCF